MTRLERRILDELEAGPLTVAELAQRLTATPSKVGSALLRLSDSGRIKRDGAQLGLIGAER